MQQRVSLCRALIHNPSVLLMDEPFAALDAMTREELGFELMRIWDADKKTVIFVTHNISEAILLADRVVAMTPRPGRIARVVDIDLARPRTIDMEFTETVQVVLGPDPGRDLSRRKGAAMAQCRWRNLRSKDDGKPGGRTDVHAEDRRRSGATADADRAGGPVGSAGAAISDPGLAAAGAEPDRAGHGGMAFRARRAIPWSRSTRRWWDSRSPSPSAFRSRSRWSTRRCCRTRSIPSCSRCSRCPRSPSRRCWRCGSASARCRKSSWCSWCASSRSSSRRPAGSPRCRPRSWT